MSIKRRLVIPFREESAVCRECDRLTPHRILCSFEGSVDDPDAWTWWNDYEMLECTHCGAVVFRHSFGHVDESRINAEDDFEKLKPEYERGESWPRHVVGLKHLEGAEHLPEPIGQLYQEAFESAAFGHTLVAVLGLRTLIQAVCRESGAGGGGLSQQIDALESRGILSHSQASFLHGIRLLGNDTAHESMQPIPVGTLTQCFTIVHVILAAQYVLPKTAPNLDAKRDPTRREPEV
jgi:hypothetical protein